MTHCTANFWIYAARLLLSSSPLPRRSTSNQLTSTTRCRWLRRNRRLSLSRRPSLPRSRSLRSQSLLRSLLKRPSSRLQRRRSLPARHPRLEVQAGYSPYGAVTLFERFAKLNNEYIIRARSPEEELSQLAIQSLEGYFRSHPQTSERLAQANAVIANERWQDRKSQKPFRVEFEVHNGQFVK